jgi:hypothetical protein
MNSSIEIPVGLPVPPPAVTKARWRQWIAFDHCRVLLSQFSFARGTDQLSRLHRLAMRDPMQPAIETWLDRTMAGTLHAFAVLHQMTVYFLEFGRYVRAKDGISRFRQLRDTWHCGWKHNQLPRHYYWRQLYLLPDRHAWLENLSHRQVTKLLDHINRHLPISHATHKDRFSEHCQEHGLPTPSAVAVWDKHGKLTTPVPEEHYGDLFVKPTTEFGSVGAFLVPCNLETATYLLNGAETTWDELLEGLSIIAKNSGRGLILQPRLRNAARSAQYGNEDICNLRIVTGCAPGGTPVAIASFMRLPSTFTTSGYNRHVLFASVDIETGRMGTGRFRDITRGEHATHPETLAQIEGHVIPGWSEMLELALRAHRTLPWLPLIGWDLIDSDQGVQVLEANAYWGGDAIQCAGATPLGRTQFPEIYLAWFHRVYGANHPALAPYSQS